jgi:serine phosphatase RsbU (regulator of sigma subunit)
MVLIYTFGVVDALNLGYEEFGLDRLIDLCTTRRASADELLTVIMHAIVEWGGGRDQGDDITLLALSVVGT